jgi:hypothetical protein
MKHTKGKWSTERTGFSDESDNNSATNGTKFMVKTDAPMFRKRNLVANVVGSESEAKANANLIASAPAMLEMLKKLDHHSPNTCRDLGVGSLIAKAEGSE